MSTYQAGICNINRQEVAYRRTWAIIGAVSTASLLVALLAFDAPRAMRLFVFLPALVASVGYYQTKHRFCVSYAASGLQNAEDGSKAAKKVSHAQALKDKAFANKINRKSTAISALFTIATLLLP